MITFVLNHETLTLGLYDFNVAIVIMQQVITSKHFDIAMVAL